MKETQKRDSSGHPQNRYPAMYWCQCNTQINQIRPNKTASQALIWPWIKMPGLNLALDQNARIWPWPYLLVFVCEAAECDIWPYLYLVYLFSTAILTSNILHVSIPPS